MSPIEGTTGVIVVNYGSPHLLRANLAPLTRSDPSLVCVVVDNFSTEANRTALRAVAAEEHWTLLTPDTNLGFGTGMNLGVQRAIDLGSARILLLNPDATLDRRAVDRLVEETDRDPLAMCAPRIERSDGSVWFDGNDLCLDDGAIWATSRRGQHPEAAVTPWLTGACLLLTAELWALVGGFRDEYFLYWEDVDLSFRVAAAGGTLVVVRDAVAIHDEGGTHDRSDAASSRAKSSTYYYYNVRNRLLFAALHLPPERVRSWRRTALSATWAILLQGGRRQFLTSTSPLRAGFSGLRDGLRLSRDAARRR